jgi:hypothetical protein
MIKTNTKRYAKRQVTWFRKDPEIQWFALPEQTAAVEQLLRKFLNISAIVLLWVLQLTGHSTAPAWFRTAWMTVRNEKKRCS